MSNFCAKLDSSQISSVRGVKEDLLHAFPSTVSGRFFEALLDVLSDLVRKEDVGWKIIRVHKKTPDIPEPECQTKVYAGTGKRVLSISFRDTRTIATT